MTRMPPSSAAAQAGPYALAVVGVLAYSRTAACTRYAKDADKAPTMDARITLLRMSAWEVGSFERIAEHASAAGIDAASAAERFITLLGDADERLRPLDWAERVVKTYLTFGLLIDLCIALCDALDAPLSQVLGEELAQDPIGRCAAMELDGAISSDAQLAARLGLWARRVVGEEISIFQRLLAQVPELGEHASADRLHEVLSQGAISRMRGLGLRV